MDRVKVYPNERVDLGDFEDVAGGLAELDNIRRGRVRDLPSGRTTGQAATSGRILGGFAFDTINFGVDQQATLNRGAGIFPRVIEGTLVYGELQGDEGAASRILDFSSAAIDTHAVYVRAVTSPGDSENRVFWNESGAPAQEFLDNVATRDKAEWEAIFQVASAPPPGQGEYVKIWEVVVGGGNVISSITDFRHFYYEGSANPTDNYAHEWGDGANDRDSDRALYGVQDDHLFAQLVRRQLADVIGPSHVAEPVSSIQKMHRTVSVDQPGGAGGDGDYATLAAAITALNAADGGTILLREGSYAITAALPAITKRVAIIGVEDGVILSNQINVDQYLLDFQGGSDHSSLLGIVISDGANTSEQAVKVGSTYFAAQQCDITGGIEVAAENASFGQCKITGSNTVVFHDRTVNLTGAFLAKFDRCLIQGGANSQAYTVRVEAASAFTRYPSKVSFVDCQIIGPGNPILVSAGTANAEVHLERCMLNVDPPTSAFGGINVTAIDRFSIRDCRMALNSAAGGNWTASAIRFVAPDPSVIEIDGLEVDFENVVPKAASVSAAPIVLAGPNTKVRRLSAYNITIPNTASSAIRAFVLIDPSIGGRGLELASCRFWAAGSEASGTIDCALLGQDATNIGSGKANIHDCVFDTSARTFAGNGEIIYGAGAINQWRIRDNDFIPGPCQRMVSIAASASLMFKGNDIDSTGTTSIAMLVRAFGNKAEVIDGHCIFADNVIHRDDISDSQVCLLDSFERIAVASNTEINVGAGSPVNGCIRVNNCTNAVYHNNNLDHGITSAGIGLELPATVSNHNIQT